MDTIALVVMALAAALIVGAAVWAAASASRSQGGRPYHDPIQERPRKDD